MCVKLETWFKTGFEVSVDFSSLARVEKKPLLTPGPDPSSPSNLTRT